VFPTIDRQGARTRRWSRSRRPGRLALIVVLAASTTIALSATTAGAATYSTYTCTAPNGQPAPASGGGYGWTSLTMGSWAGYSSPWVDNCSGSDVSQPQGLISANTAALGRALNSGQGWEYKTPPGTRITSYQLWGAASSREQLGNNTNSFVLATSGNGFPGDWVTPGAGDYNGGQPYPGGAPWISVAGRDADNIQIWAGVGGPAANGPTPAYGAAYINSSVRVTKAVVTASDASSPVVGSVTGDAVSNGTWHGTESMSLAASDSGSGIYRLIVRTGPNASNLTTRSQEIISANSGRCAPAPGTSADQRIFAYAAPCATSLAKSVDINSADLPEGRYFVRILVEDASGNATVAYETTKTVDNLAPIVGATIAGSAARVGDVLTCVPSVNGQSPTTTVTWERTLPDGSGATAISGAAGETYKLTVDDVGRKVRCRVTATDQGGTAAAASSITDGPFASGGLVTGYCTGRPTGSRDECGDLDGDGIPNYLDSDIDGDGVGNGADADPYDPNVPGKGNDGGTNVDPGKQGNGEDSKPGHNDDGGGDPKPLPANNGSNAASVVQVTASWAVGGKTSKTIAYTAASNARTIRGVVTTPAGKPVEGAQLDVVATAAVPGATPVAKTGLITRAGGKFTLRLEGGIGSRKMLIRYRPNLASSVVGGQATVDLTVRSAVSLRGRVTRGSQGRPRFQFSGVLKGKPFPKPGQLVEIRVKRGKSWSVVGSPVRASSSGRFKMTYQVATRIRPGVRFSFRAVARTSATWAFRGSNSKTVRVTTR